MVAQLLDGLLRARLGHRDGLFGRLDQVQACASIARFLALRRVPRYFASQLESSVPLVKQGLLLASRDPEGAHASDRDRPTSLRVNRRAKALTQGLLPSW